MNRKSSINNSNNRLLYDPNHDKERRLGTFSMQEDLDEEETPEETENTGEDSIEETPESNENIKDNDGQSETKEDTNSTRKEVAKTAVKEGAKQAGKAAGKAATKATGAVAAKIGALIAANPWILVVIVIIVILLIIILVILGGSIEDNNSYSSSYLENCSEFPLNTTSLSKSDFISYVEDYFTGSNYSYASTFIENADSIYDLSVKNNINPELVIVRAIKEGGSPGGQTNNYWGIGCFNGSSSCDSYPSFDEGVLAFIENVSQYISVDEMMSRYAYIGSYWYNPGSYSLGGCKYYEVIKEYMSSSRANEVAQICSSNSYCDAGGGTNCVATTDEDQLAYAKWQVSSMSEVRYNIFNLNPAVCNSYSNTCTLYSQSDPNWSGIHLGNSSSTMGAAGCAVTSLAIAISCLELDTSIENFNAGTFVTELNEGSCFNAGGNINWSCSKLKEIVPSLNFVASVALMGSNENKISTVQSYAQDYEIILLHFVNSEHVAGHFVVYTGMAGNTFVTRDPAGGKISNINVSDVDGIRLFNVEDINE